VSWKDIQDIQWQSNLFENNESHDINKRSDTSAMNSDCIWEYLISRNHAEVTLNNRTRRSAQKWSNRQDDWWCTWVIFIADQASAHWNDDVTDVYTETDQTDMKSSLKKEIQRSSFSISDIRDNSSASAFTQRSCEVLQRTIDAATHQENWLQSISTWKMSTWYHYDDVQVWQRLNVNQAHFINMFKIKDRTKDDAMQREHHELKKASKNHERDNSDHSNDTLDKHTESISDCDVIKELNERERK